MKVVIQFIFIFFLFLCLSPVKLSSQKMDWTLTSGHWTLHSNPPPWQSSFLPTMVHLKYCNLSLLLINSFEHGSRIKGLNTYWKQHNSCKRPRSAFVIFTSFIQANATNNSKVTLLLLFVTTTFCKPESNVLSMLHLCVIKMTNPCKCPLSHFVPLLSLNFILCSCNCHLRQFI